MGLGTYGNRSKRADVREPDGSWHRDAQTLLPVSYLASRVALDADGSNSGIFGLNNQPVNFSTLGNTSVPSFVSTLKDQGKIPSISWSYTAGAKYRKHSSRSIVPDSC